MTVPTWLEENVRALGYSSYDEYLAKYVYPNSFSGFVNRDLYGNQIYGVDDRYNAGVINNPAVLQVIEAYGVPEKAYIPSWDDPYFFSGLDKVLNAVKDQFTTPSVNQVVATGKSCSAQQPTIFSSSGQTTGINQNETSTLKYLPLAIGIGGLGLALYGLFKW